MDFCGSRLCSLRITADGTTPWRSRRTAPGSPTSTCVSRNSTFPLARSSARSTSFTRTTFRPPVSMICWSIRSFCTASQDSFGRYSSNARSPTFSFNFPADIDATWLCLATSG